MAKPVDDVSWATNATYAAGADPYAGQANTLAPLSGRVQQGWEPGKKPGAQTMNWWQRAVARWIQFLGALFNSDGSLVASNTITKNLGPGKMTFATNAAYAGGLVAGDGGANIAIVASGNGGWFIDLEVPSGYRLASLTLLHTGHPSGPTAGLAFSIVASPSAVGPEATLHAKGGTTSAAASDISFNLDEALTPGTSVTIGSIAGGATFSWTYIIHRTAGSWITDGFEVGQAVDMSGFTNAGNNRTYQSVTGVTASDLTMSGIGSDPSPVAETTAAAVIVNSNARNSATQSIALFVSAVGTNGCGTRALRTTYKRAA